jgi:hypothetical protein
MHELLVSSMTEGGQKRREDDIVRCLARLTNNFLLKDCCALPDQMSFVLTFSGRAFVFAMGKRDRTNWHEIAVFTLRNHEGLSS